MMVKPKQGVAKKRPSSTESPEKSEEIKRRSTVVFSRYECSKCLKQFSDKSEFKQHSRTHSNIQPFKCKLCNTKFARKRHCVDHIKKQHSKTTNLNKFIDTDQELLDAEDQQLNLSKERKSLGKQVTENWPQVLEMFCEELQMLINGQFPWADAINKLKSFSEIDGNSSLPPSQIVYLFLYGHIETSDMLQWKTDPEQRMALFRRFLSWVIYLGSGSWGRPEDHLRPGNLAKDTVSDTLFNPLQLIN